jgi:hypothetical protein
VKAWPNALACAAFVVAGLWIGHALDLAARDTALEQFVHDKGRGTARIALRYGLANGQCGDLPTTDLFALARAFVTTESFATPWVEHWGKRVSVHAAALAGIVPDMSLGPGRIRPSTAQRAIVDAPGDDVDQTAYRELPLGALTAKLFGTCDSVRIAAIVLSAMRREHALPQEVDRAFVRRAAVIYNGQSTLARSLDANVSAEVYFQLVYAMFQHYRFSFL